MRSLLLFICISFLLIACQDEPKVEKDALKSAVQNVTDHRELSKTYVPFYCNLSKPIDAFSYHYFSSKKNKDQFQLYIPAGKIRETTGFLLVQNSLGDTLMFQEFPSLLIINGYDLEQYNIDSYQAMVKYLNLKMTDKINSESFIYTNHDDENVLGSILEEDVEDLPLFHDCLTMKLPVFIFALGEEDSHYYVFNTSTKKAAQFYSCC